MWQRLLGGFVVTTLLAVTSLAVGALYPAYKVWLAAGAAVALVTLWGPIMVICVAAGTALASWWWTGHTLGSMLFAVEQASVALAAWGGLKWLSPAGIRLQTLGDMARFISVAGAGYALAGSIALTLVPESVKHVRSDVAKAVLHPQAPVQNGGHQPPSRTLEVQAHAGPVHTADHQEHPAATHATPSHGASLHVGSSRFEWALADMLGVLLVTPVVLCALRVRPSRLPSDEADPRGALAALGLLLSVSVGIYSGWIESTFGFRHTTLLVLPPAVWLALRHPMAYTLFGNLAAVVIADIGTSLGHGPFSDHTSGLPILHLVFVGTTLMMAASQAERALATAEVRRLATRDPLTDLPNRNLLALHLETALTTAQRYQQRVGVLFIDLDHFKRVNDSLGHSVGDRLLVAAAERIASVLRTDSLLARVGGDEFVAVMERMQDPEDVSRAAARIISALAHPFAVGPHLLCVSCSVGVASYPDDGACGAELIKNADIAMYEAKSSGRDQYRFFSPAMNERVHERMEIENGLRSALQHGRFVLHYQPIFEARSGCLAMVEALLRWKRPDGSLTLPGQFIDVAEDTGLIEGIGNWVITQSARQVSQWRGSGFHTTPMCVNLSVRQLRNARSLSDHVRQTLQQHELKGQDFTLEITESMLLHLGGEAEEALKQLAHRGITLALDDFGTGYSSLGYLARLPINCLKIDRHFITDIVDRPGDLKLVRAMIELAHLLEMKVVAEGVETHQQHERLRELGVDYLQGHFLGLPQEPDAFAASYLRIVFP